MTSAVEIAPGSIFSIEGRQYIVVEITTRLGGASREVTVRALDPLTATQQHMENEQRMALMRKSLEHLQRMEG